LKRRNRRAKLLLLGNVMIGKRNRKKICGDSRRDRRKGNKRRRTRQEISNKVIFAGQMNKGGGKFREEGKMTLLARGKRSTCLGNGRHKRLVVSEKGKRSAFKEKTEMTDGEIGSQKFTVKSGVTGLSRGKFVGKESQGLPGASSTLLEDCTHMRVRGVRSKGEGGRRTGML
jgi:hypothetical protein